MDETTIPVSPDDRIFLGDGLFETIRFENTRPLYPTMHWQRLRESAKLLSISLGLSDNILSRQLIGCIKSTGFENGGVKIVLSGGRAARGLVEQGLSPLLFFRAFENKASKAPLHLVTAPWSRDAKNPVYQVKSVNYLEAIMARRAALAAGAHDALFFNVEQHAMETTVANLFMIKEGMVFTPKLTDGVLPGMIRHRILRLCQDHGIYCKEVSMDRNQLISAEALFTTNALEHLRSVKLFDGHEFQTHHPLFKQLEYLLANDSERWS